MFKTVKRVGRFNTSDAKDLKVYEEILNDPNATIVSTIKEKISEKTFNEEGKMESLTEYLLLVVTWQEKQIL